MNTSNSVCVCLMPSVNYRQKAREDLVNYSRCVCVCVCVCVWSGALSLSSGSVPDSDCVVEGANEHQVPSGIEVHTDHLC